ncbi:MAG: universal stress protein [Xenococcus sp. MO_188.B8]|nr:universal stress protein [Xenococcus sp. MO_188.B8]
MPFSKIMIAVEKPPLAFKVAETGFALANALNAQVYLVHVNPSALLYTPDSGMSETQIEAKMIEQTEELLQQITRLYAGSLEPIPLVLEGNIEQELLTVIQDIQPELLVLGTHAKKPWKEMLLGSVSEDLVRNSTCPVMLIRESE